MNCDELLDAYRKQVITRTELFASLAYLLSSRPDELDATRSALAFDEWPKRPKRAG